MPEWRTEIRRRLAGARLRAEREAEIVDEVAQHLEEAYREKLSAGQPPANAEASAWEELEADDVLAAEIARSEPANRPMPPPGIPSRGSVAAALWQDTRFAIRRLVKRPAFALTAIVTVALTIGPTTAVLGIADVLFFRQPPGIAAPERLLQVQFGTARGTSFSPWSVSYANVKQILEGAANVSGAAGFTQVSAGLSANSSDPQRVAGQSVQSNFFAFLGVPMAAGRGFLEEEDSTPGGVASVVLAEPAAREMFGGAQAALGQIVQLNSVPFTVVGVTAPSFEGAGSTAKFWIPGRTYHRVRHFAPALWTYDTNRGPFSTYLFRLAPGASAVNAELELRARVAGLASTGQQGADLFKTVGLRVEPGFGAPRSTNKNGVEVVRQLAVIAGILVLLGIANMANLLIFQGLKLSREVAIRKALGASVARLIQLTIVESVLLSAAGSIVGIGIALAIPELLSGISVWGIGTITVPIDWRVLGGTVALAVVTGIAFGVGPALLAARGPALAALGRGLRTELPRGGRLRQTLAAAQLALSLVLLVGALLFLTTLKNLRDVDLGFDASNVTTMQMDLRSHGYDPPRMFAYYEQLLSLLKQQPGVEHAAVTYALPAAGMSFSSSLHLPGEDPKAAPEILFNFVSASYFDVLRVPIARGRAFTPNESFNASNHPIILSASAARKLFGDADPLGRIVVEPGRGGGDRVVIGVTAEGRWRGATAPPDAVAYQPFGPGIAVTGAAVIVRSARPSHDVVKLIQDASASIDRSTPLFLNRTMEAILDGRLARQRLFAWVLGLLGVIGFTLAAIGVHSLVSQMVAERAREFGIRLAIGAARADVLRLVVRQAAIVAAIGIAAGLGVAMFSGKLIEASLFGVTSREPMVYASAAGLLLLVVGVAVVGPARAALRVQPISVLRSE